MSSHRSIVAASYAEVSADVALQGANNLAEALSADTLSATGESDSTESFSVGSIAERYANEPNIFGLHPTAVPSHTFVKIEQFIDPNNGEIHFAPIFTDTILPDESSSTFAEDEESFVLENEIPADRHNGVDMFILVDGTLIDTYVPKLLPSGRAMKRDPNHSEYSDWNIGRMVLTSKARKIRESVSSELESVETDSKILVSFRIISIRGIRLIQQALKSGDGYISASHFVASKFLSSVPELAMSDLSTFHDKSKKAGSVSTSPASSAQVSMAGLAAITKVQFLELFAALSDEDKVALREKLMA